MEELKTLSDFDKIVKTIEDHNLNQLLKDVFMVDSVFSVITDLSQRDQQDFLNDKTLALKMNYAFIYSTFAKRYVVRRGRKIMKE